MHLIKYFSVIGILGFLFLTYASSPSAGVRVKSYYSVPDSGKKADTSGRGKEKGNIAQPWTPHALDSSFKNMRIWVKFLDTTGISPWRHISWENISELVKSNAIDTFWLARDSAFVFKSKGCIKIYGILGKNPTVPDTIVWEDTCNTCDHWVRIPLGCWDTTKVIVWEKVNKLICDTS
jgi:hypothetical protein